MYIFQPDRYILQQQIKKVAHYIKGTVLDVGAGEYDRYSDYFTSEKYIRMDINHREDVDLVGSADNIPLPNESVDSVVSTQVFEHLRYPQKSAEEIYRVLRKGGVALITVPQINELHEELYDFFRYTNFGMMAVFEDVGFKTVEYSQRGGFFSTIAQCWIRYIVDKFHLYKHPFLGRVVGKLLLAYGRFMIWLDSKDTSVANRKNTIGWCFIFKK